MNIQIKKKILNYIGKERVITSSELAEHLKVNWNTAQNYLMRLLIENKVIEKKKKGVNLWMRK
jgi:ribosomal protein S25